MGVRGKTILKKNKLVPHISTLAEILHAWIGLVGVGGCNVSKTTHNQKSHQTLCQVSDVAQEDLYEHSHSPIRRASAPRVDAILAAVNSESPEEIMSNIPISMAIFTATSSGNCPKNTHQL